MKLTRAALALTASVAILLQSGAPVSAAELAIRSDAVNPNARDVRVVPRFNWNYNHMYGPAYSWPDGAPATPDRVLVRPGLQPIGLYRGHHPYCMYGTATYRAQGGRYPCG